ncbi:MAG: ribosome-associated protein [Gammaproteobacteria bacterium]|jgi:ribosome-associated protein
MSAELTPEALRDLVASALDDGKAEDIRVLDVRGMTSITDFMIVASGRSSRQVRSLKDRVVDAAREHNIRPLGVEGENPGEWVLVDLGDVIVHTMQKETRDFYQLEKLWDNDVSEPQLAEQASER